MPEQCGLGQSNMALSASWASKNRISAETVQLLMGNGFFTLEDISLLDRTALNELGVTPLIQKTLLLKAILRLKTQVQKASLYPSPANGQGTQEPMAIPGASAGNSQERITGIPLDTLMNSFKGLDSSDRNQLRF